MKEIIFHLAMISTNKEGESNKDGKIVYLLKLCEVYQL